MKLSGRKEACAGLFIVLLGGVLAAAVAAAFAARIGRDAIVRHGFQDLAWGDLSFARVAASCLWLVPLFLLIWFATNYYVHRRTGANLAGLLFRDAPCFLAGAPLVGALAAFGPADGRPDFLTTVSLLYLAVLAWKLFPMLKAALSGGPIRLRDVLAAVLAIGLGLFVLDHPRPLDGDEPHYLMIADSLRHGNGVDLTRSYQGKNYASFFRGDLTGHTMIVADRTTGQEALRPTHYPGLPALIFPGYALAGAAGAKLTIVLIAAAAIAGLFSLLARVNVRREVAAAGALAVASSSPLVTYGLQLYPEIVAGAMVVWGVVLLVERRFSWVEALAVGALASALPWLHVRYLPLSAALAVCAAVRCRLRLKGILPLALPAAASALGFAAYCGFVFAGAHVGMDVVLPGHHPALSLHRSVHYFLAMFLDSQGGVFAYAPGLMLAPLGAILLWRANRAAAGIILMTVAAEAALIAIGFGEWHGGWAPPSRYMACVSPLVAAFAIVAYDRGAGSGAFRRLSQALFAIGIFFGLLMVADPESLYNAHFAWSLPAITESYRWIRIGWVFPNYSEGGGRTIALTLFWAAAIALLTWLSLRAARDCDAAVNRGPGASSR